MEDLKRLPEFNTNEMNRYKWRISQAPVFMWSKECIDKYNIHSDDVIDDLQYTMKALDEHRQLNIYSTVFWLICLSVVTMHVMYFWVAKCCDLNVCYSFLNFLEIIFLIARCIFLILILITFIQIKNMFGDTTINTLQLDESRTCSDQVGNSVINDFLLGLYSSVLKHQVGLYLTFGAIGRCMVCISCISGLTARSCGYA